MYLTFSTLHTVEFVTKVNENCITTIDKEVQKLGDAQLGERIAGVLEKIKNMKVTIS